MTAPVIKGWCPGALHPMESGDGLIVRLRIGSGIVSMRLASEIAVWAARWGNGQIDLSGRGNMQLRGMLPPHLADLHDALAEWGLLDRDVAGEAIRNVISSPLAGLDPRAVLDIRPLAKALEQRLAADTSLHGLPAKFAFVIDDGGWPGLEEVPADVQFVACQTADGPAFEIRLAGAPHDRLAPCRPEQLVDVAAALGRLVLEFRTGREKDVRRMRDVVDARGAEAIARDLGITHRCTPPRLPTPLGGPPNLVGAQPLGRAAFLGVGLPFGRISAEDLAKLSSAVATHGGTELRLTPWRAILVPVASIQAARALANDLSTGPFILDAGDPRRRVAACPGAPDCSQATTPVRSDAARLAAEMAGTSVAGITLHVSGCSKGCAHPGPAMVTLVGHNGRYLLVRDGQPSDEPEQRDLCLDQAARHVRRIIAVHPEIVAGPTKDVAR
jgi:precorrin-3B synthase